MPMRAIEVRKQDVRKVKMRRNDSFSTHRYLPMVDTANGKAAVDQYG
jgi:hypothetical protein